jgi:hypothetical protein
MVLQPHRQREPGFPWLLHQLLPDGGPACTRGASLRRTSCSNSATILVAPTTLAAGRVIAEPKGRALVGVWPGVTRAAGVGVWTKCRHLRGPLLLAGLCKV